MDLSGKCLCTGQMQTLNEFEQIDLSNSFMTYALSHCNHEQVASAEDTFGGCIAPDIETSVQNCGDAAETLASVSDRR